MHQSSKVFFIGQRTSHCFTLFIKAKVTHFARGYLETSLQNRAVTVKFSEYRPPRYLTECYSYFVQWRCTLPILWLSSLMANYWTLVISTRYFLKPFILIILSLLWLHTFLSVLKLLYFFCFLLLLGWNSDNLLTKEWIAIFVTILRAQSRFQVLVCVSLAFRLSHRSWHYMSIYDIRPFFTVSKRIQSYIQTVSGV